MKLNLLKLENGIQLSLDESFSKNGRFTVSTFDDAWVTAAFDAFCAVKFAIVVCSDVTPSPTPQCVNTTIFIHKKRKNQEENQISMIGNSDIKYFEYNRHTLL